MKPKCFRCKTGNLEVIDVDNCSITVFCDECNEEYRIEPDGLGQGGLEWIDAMIRKENGEFGF